MNRAEATCIIQEIAHLFLPWKFEIAGSYRRHKEEVNDIDVITLGPPDEINQRIEKAGIAVLEMGKAKTSFMTGGHLNVQVDIRFTDEAHFGTMLLYFTGSKDFDIRLRSIAKAKGLKLTEYGISLRENWKTPYFGDPSLQVGQVRTFADEKEVFAYLGLQVTPPFLRNGRGSIKAKRVKT